MADYNVRYTDRNVSPINIPEAEVNDTALDVVLFGRINPEYGEKLDEDLLNLLENFACPEDPTTTDFNNAKPDLTQTSKAQLSKPTVGQLWFNSTRDTVYYWRGDVWWPIPLREYVAANWGSLLDGQQLPKPVSPITGHVFDYADCIWSVAPAAFTGKIGAVSCGTDPNAVVTMKYRLSGTNTVLSGLANYLIIGIRGNYNAGQSIPPIQFTPTPTPSVTPSVAASSTPTPTPTRNPTPTNTPTLTRTPTPTPAVSVSATVTPTPAPSLTPSATRTPTPAPSNTPSPSPIPITSIILAGDYNAHSNVQDGATAGAGIGFLNTGVVGKTGLSTSGPSPWLAGGYNAADFEVSFSGNFEAQFPGNSWYSTPAGNNTMGTPGAWYNLGTSRAWSCGTNRDIVSFFVSYTIRQISTGRTVSGSINLGGTAGTPI